MDLFGKELDNFVKNAITGISLRIDQTRNSLNDDYEVSLAAAKEEGFLFAVNEDIDLSPKDPDVNVTDILSDNNVIAPYMRVGTLTVPYPDGSDKVEYPLSIPLKDINAYFFDFGVKNVVIRDLFQKLMMRMLLSTRPDLMQFSFVDMDFIDFSLPLGVQKIKNNCLKCSIFTSSREIVDLMNDLMGEVRENGQKLAGKYSNVDEFNAHNTADPIPYHIVFIDDFPNGFSTESFNVLFRLIHNGIANKAGIKIFINYCGLDNTQLYSHDNLNVDALRKLCDCISLDGNDDLRLVDKDEGEFVGGSFVPDSISISETDQLLSVLRNYTPPERIYSLDEWVQSLIAENKVWSGSTINGIKVPIGFVDSSEYYNFYIANANDVACNDYFTLVAGNPGMGKSTLVRNIIVNAALKYSPDELNFYLADFGNGTSLGIFRNLPHTRALMLANSKEYALRILQDIEKNIIEKRASDFERVQMEKGVEVDNFTTYRKVTGEKIPYILLVMDEFHALFNSSDTITDMARKQLCDGIRQWRKYGIGAILCTQSIEGVRFGEADEYITYRFALQLSKENSQITLRNNAAAGLTGKGQTIVNNTPNGAENANVMFHSAYSKNYLGYVEYLAKLYGKPVKPFICEIGIRTDMADNVALSSMLTNEPAANVNDCDLYVGKPDLLRIGHSRIRLSRRLNSNLLLLGDDYDSLVRIISTSMMQIEAQSPQGSTFYIVNSFNSNEEQYAVFDELPDSNGFVRSYHSQQAEQVIGEVWDDLQKRKQLQQESKYAEERIVLSILNTQNCTSLRPVSNGLRPDMSPSAKKLVEIIKDGPSLGVHVIIHALYLKALFDRDAIFEDKLKEQFSNCIVMTNAGIANGDGICGTRFINSITKKGRVVLFNNRIDNEPYEQCVVYNRCSFSPSSILGSYLSVKFFVESSIKYH